MTWDQRSFNRLKDIFATNQWNGKSVIHQNLNKTVQLLTKEVILIQITDHFQGRKNIYVFECIFIHKTKNIAFTINDNFFNIARIWWQNWKEETFLPFSVIFTFTYSVHGWHQLIEKQTWPGAWDKHIVYIPHLVIWRSCDWCPLVEICDGLAYDLLSKYIFTCSMFTCRMLMSPVTDGYK